MQGFLDHDQIAALLDAYGYPAIFLIVALESAGLPLPGETLLIGGAIYARVTGALSIESVVAAAASGAIVGDAAGYWFGRSFGLGLLERHGHMIGIGPKKLLLVQYLFRRFGGLVVFFGRFVTILRILAAAMAGVARFDFGKFLLFNASGGILWAAAFGYGAYYLTAGFERIEGPVAFGAMCGLLVWLFGLWRYAKAHEQRLLAEAEAEAAREGLGGPLS